MLVWLLFPFCISNKWNLLFIARRLVYSPLESIISYNLYKVKYPYFRSSLSWDFCPVFEQCKAQWHRAFLSHFIIKNEQATIAFLSICLGDFWCCRLWAGWQFEGSCTSNPYTREYRLADSQSWEQVHVDVSKICDAEPPTVAWLSRSDGSTARITYIKVLGSAPKCSFFLRVRFWCCFSLSYSGHMQQATWSL